MSLDDRIAAYYSLQGCAQDIVDSTGTVYDPECSKCGFKKRHWKGSLEIWVCGRCGEEWGSEDVELLKGEVCRRSRTLGMVTHAIPAPRPGEHENRLVALVNLGYHLNRMLRDDYWRWPMQVLVGFAVTSCGYAELAIHANAYDWPTRDGTEWTDSRCEWWAGRARGELGRRMRQDSRAVST